MNDIILWLFTIFLCRFLPLWLWGEKKHFLKLSNEENHNQGQVELKKLVKRVDAGFRISGDPPNKKYSRRLQDTVVNNRRIFLPNSHFYPKTTEVLGSFRTTNLIGIVEGKMIGLYTICFATALIYYRETNTWAVSVCHTGAYSSTMRSWILKMKGCGCLLGS